MTCSAAQSRWDRRTLTDEEGADFLGSSLHRSKLEREAAGGKMTFVRGAWIVGGRFGRRRARG